MNRLPSSASFQGVLDSIIRNYLLNELPPNGAENGNARQHVAEKDLGLLQETSLHMQYPRGHGGSEVNNNAGPVPSTSTAANNANTFTSGNAVDHEYIKAIYQSFEKRGVFKELQTFLRHKLVSILQDEWPNLQKPVAANQREGPNTIVYKLVDDFLRCHKLLYTLSVLASESDVKPQSTRVLYGKLSAKEAEDLLNEMGIKHDSRLSGQILKCYFDKENFSLLESIHYLGVWLDEASGQDDDASSETHARRKESTGEFIALSKRKTEEIIPCACSRTKEKTEKNGVNTTGIERRLLELEKTLEREKEFKIKEAIEKYKKDGQVKLRQELEMKFKLQLIEKEREYFVDLQKKMEEVNAERQQEREQWFELKLELEKELCDVKKQLNETIHASGDNAWRDASMKMKHVPLSNGESSPDRSQTATKACQAAMDVTSVKCSCGKRSCHANGGETFSANCHRKLSVTLDPIEQDRLAFLQYRMEQQDEEIKSLRNQLLLASQRPTARPKVHSAPNKSITGGTHKAPEGQQEEPSSNTDTPDDLEAFLSSTKARVQKLDTAVDKVDEIVQEIFAKRRSPLSKDLTSCLLSAAMNKSKPSLAQLYSSLHTMSSAPLLSPMMNIRPVVPLLHQQVPEKQSAYAPANPQKSPPMTTIYPPISTEMTMTSYPSPPLPSWVRPHAEASRTDFEIYNRPETPVDRIFPVAYAQPTHADQKRKESKESPSESSSRTALKSPREPFRSSKSSNGTTRKHDVLSPVVDEPEESLFHMAMRESLAENTGGHNETFEEKAIRNGALSREKILSSDEGENSVSLSVSISESQSKKVSNPIMKMKPVLRKNDTGRAISKSKVSETPLNKADQLPLKVASFGTNSEQSSTPPFRKVTSSSSSSSSRKSKSEARNSVHDNTRENKQSNQEDVDEQSSLSISVPKSANGEDNNEDFWQL